MYVLLESVLGKYAVSGRINRLKSLSSFILFELARLDIGVKAFLRG